MSENNQRTNMEIWKTNNKQEGNKPIENQPRRIFGGKSNSEHNRYKRFI